MSPTISQRATYHPHHAGDCVRPAAGAYPELLQGGSGGRLQAAVELAHLHAVGRRQRRNLAQSQRREVLRQSLGRLAAEGRGSEERLDTQRRHTRLRHPTGPRDVTGPTLPLSYGCVYVWLLLPNPE